MKLETFFFEKFNQFAEAPNAVAKMRELVLHLAAHGKLVEQCSDDEPASDLVNRIEIHFELLLSRNELRFSPLAPLDDSDLLALPSSWQWVRLGNVVAYGSPAKAESANIPPDSWLLDLEDIEKDTSRLLQRKTFHDSPSTSTKAAFEAGDVLYGKLRPYLNKVLVADASGYCTTEIIPIRTFGFIEPAYLCYALKRPEFLAYAVSKSYGMNLPRLGTSDARNAAFPLPPLAEQKRIVAKVDELMALCDRLETHQKERDTRHATLARASLNRFADAPTPANLNYLFHDTYTVEPTDLRKTILTLAVQGKLVPQDVNDKPAESLNDKILLSLKTIAKHVGARFTKPSALIESRDDLPAGWGVAPLLSVGITQTGTTPSKSEPSFEGNHIPFIKPGDIKGDVIDYENEGLSIDGLRAGRLIPRDSILMVSIGGSIGKTALVDRDVSCNQQINSVTPAECIAPRFILAAIRSQDFQNEVINRAAQCTLPIISKSKWEAIRVPIPPLAEQRRIVARVDQLMTLVDQLEAQLVASHTAAINLMEAVVAEVTVQE